MQFMKNKIDSLLDLCHTWGKILTDLRFKDAWGGWSNDLAGKDS